MTTINIGDKFNKLTVLEKTNQRINCSIIYKCQCDGCKSIFAYNSKDIDYVLFPTERSVII